ncbi:hypothetical protein G6F22_021071 [Rhizopus arrhizus]|nr:hypothetical protein G6F22_021071 [Rhizopus arrhizus]
MGQPRETASRALKQTIALRTRLDKAPEISREELQRDWERQAVELGVEFDSGKRPLDHGKDREQEAGGDAENRAASVTWDGHKAGRS